MIKWHKLKALKKWQFEPSHRKAMKSCSSLFALLLRVEDVG